MSVLGMKGITRFDHGRTHGWWVRVQWNGKMQRKMFSDGKHGGRDEALRKAVVHRDLLVITEGAPITNKNATGKAVSNTGLVGITEGQVRRGAKKKPVAYFGVSCGPFKTKISIRKHGRAKALRLARKARARFEKQYFGSISG